MQGKKTRVAASKPRQERPQKVPLLTLSGNNAQGAPVRRQPPHSNAAVVKLTGEEAAGIRARQAPQVPRPQVNSLTEFPDLPEPSKPAILVASAVIMHERVESAAAAAAANTAAIAAAEVATLSAHPGLPSGEQLQAAAATTHGSLPSLAGAALRQEEQVVLPALAQALKSALNISPTDSMLMPVSDRAVEQAQPPLLGPANNVIPNPASPTLVKDAPTAPAKDTGAPGDGTQSISQGAENQAPVTEAIEEGQQAASQPADVVLANSASEASGAVPKSATASGHAAEDAAVPAGDATGCSQDTVAADGAVDQSSKDSVVASAAPAPAPNAALVQDEAPLLASSAGPSAAPKGPFVTIATSAQGASAVDQIGSLKAIGYLSLPTAVLGQDEADAVTPVPAASNGAMPTEVISPAVHDGVTEAVTTAGATMIVSPGVHNPGDLQDQAVQVVHSSAAVAPAMVRSTASTVSPLLSNLPSGSGTALHGGPPVGAALLPRHQGTSHARRLEEELRVRTQVWLCVLSQRLACMCGTWNVQVLQKF